MTPKEDSIDIIHGRLELKRWKELAMIKNEHEERKAEYEKVYQIQFDEYKLNNERFGGNKEGIKPEDYNKMLDKELLAIAQNMEREQEEEQQQDEEKDLDPRIAAFRQRMREMDEQNEKDRNRGIEY